MQWIKSILEKHVDDEGKLNLEEAQTEINKEFPQHAVPKSDFNEKNEELKQAKAEVKQRDDQLKELGDVKPEELQEKIVDLQKANEDLSKANEAELKQLKVEHAADMEIMASGAKNLKVVKALIDLEKAELGDDGKVIGLSEQLKTAKESDGYAFNEPEETKKPGFKGAEPGKTKVDGKEDNPVTKKLIDMDYVERLELKESNPEQYEKLLKQ